MNMPGFKAEFALRNSGHYRTTGSSLSRGASIRPQIRCSLNPDCLEEQWECEREQKCYALPSRLQAACLRKCQALCPPICR
jgi:hypothetical protein